MKAQGCMHAGSKEHKGTVQRMMQPGSPSDTIKSKSKRPCLLFSQLPSGGSASHERCMHAGSKEHKGTVQRMVQPGGIGHASTSDTIKSKSKRPCLVVRPAVSSHKALDFFCGPQA